MQLPTKTRVKICVELATNWYIYEQSFQKRNYKATSDLAVCLMRHCNETQQKRLHTSVHRRFAVYILMCKAHGIAHVKQVTG